MRTAYGSRSWFFDEESIARFERCGQMSAYEAFCRAMGEVRQRAVRERRLEEAIAEANGNEVLGVKEVARELELNSEVVQRRMAAGKIRGAFIQHGRWGLRRVDLWRQLSTGRTDEEVSC